MKLVETNFYKRSYASLLNAIENNDNAEWKKILNEFPFFDGFLVLNAYPKLSKWLRRLGFEDINQWLMQADTWAADAFDAINEPSADVMALSDLWNNLKIRVQELLRKGRLNADIPNTGGALIYIDGISKCLVINYVFSDSGNSRRSESSLPVINIIEIIDNPRSVFDFWGIISQKDMLHKNMLKEILSTGHKIIIHRDTLIHVDRRKDLQVFGPSIDTLLLSEIISQSICEGDLFNCESALEVGCGNGLLTVNIAKNCPSLKEIYSFDVNFNALNCTHRNLKGVISPLKERKIARYLISGKFKGGIINKKFDFIVCNPPYIPLYENNKNTNNIANYFQAVGGLELIDELLESLSLTLNENGRLLLLVSNLSLDYTLRKIPNEYKYELIIKDGFDVPFDVEAVLSKKEWVDYLIDECGLQKHSQGNYSHKLYPMWIFKKQ